MIAEPEFDPTLFVWRDDAGGDPLPDLLGWVTRVQHHLGLIVDWANSLLISVVPLLPEGLCCVDLELNTNGGFVALGRTCIAAIEEAHRFHEELTERGAETFQLVDETVCFGSIVQACAVIGGPVALTQDALVSAGVLLGPERALRCEWLTIAVDRQEAAERALFVQLSGANHMLSLPIAQGV